MKKTLVNILPRVALLIFLLQLTLLALAQDVADSDLSNNAGTNKNFKEQWWLFGVIALVVVILLFGYVRRRGRRV